MIGLVFTDPKGNRVHEVAVVDRPLTVGRANDVDIALPFKAVSRYHARFFVQSAVLYVEDLGSANGVLVGGHRIAGPTPLQPGSQARIGVINVAVTGPPGAAQPYQQPQGYFEDVPTDPQMGAYAAQQSEIPPYPGPQIQGYGASQPPGPQPYVAPPEASPEPPTEPSSAPSGMAGSHAEPPTEPDAPGVDGRPTSVDAAPGPAHEAAFAAGAEGADPAASAPVPSASQQRAESEARPDESTSAMPVVPRLIGQNGNLKGKVFFLDAPEFTVGRIKGVSLVIEDASVSRNHAKIIRKDEDLTLYDLRSFNGTFVNDEKVTRAELQGGETIRFGDIAFTLLLVDMPTVEGPKKKPMDARKRRRMLTLAAVGVLLVILIGVGNILKNRQGPPPPPDPEELQRQLQSKIRRQLDRGGAELRRRDWDTATATLQDVLKLDPLNEEAVLGLKQARVEKERGGWLEESERIAQAGRDLERAKEFLTKIPESSSYYADARLKLRQINRTIAEEARNRGLSFCRAWRYEECQSELCTFFQTWPLGEPIPDEVRVRRALERAESRLRRSRRSEFEPCKIPEPGTGDAAADAAIRERYPDEKIRRAVISYYQGRADDGARALSALEKTRGYRDQSEVLGRLIENMIRVQNSSADAHRDVRGGRLEEAEQSYAALKRADAAIIPSGFTSRYVREAGKIFGDAYHQQGEEQMRSGRLREAFAAWSRGKELAPQHHAILQALLTLESRAREACQAARDRTLSGDTNGAASHFELCRDITPPSSPLHQGAVEALRNLGR